jgi:hypothetical protein
LIFDIFFFKPYKNNKQTKERKREMKEGTDINEMKRRNKNIFRSLFREE